ncbi:hypothetical protein NPIL_327501 [Nephila pilipes]|uniref:Uncharacterized protein n=1 Tax=Nephila pilipes TaxID=299642 RepID=A0A8X6MSI9_NEPPI|nr:hypothetical protein NPIL_327501 [Nephila pilipes]
MGGSICIFAVFERWASFEFEISGVGEPQFHESQTRSVGKPLLPSVGCRRDGLDPHQRRVLIFGKRRLFSGKLSASVCFATRWGG